MSSAYKIAALKRAEKYELNLRYGRVFDEVTEDDKKKILIAELARQLNEGYKFMISK